MSKAQDRILRLRSLVDRRAKAQYEALLEKRRLANVREKAQIFRDREIKDLVDSGAARQVGDKIILPPQPATYHSLDAHSDMSTQGGIEVTVEGDVTEDQMQRLVSLHQELVFKDSEYRRNTTIARVEHDEKPVTIDPDAALHFVTTGELPENATVEEVEYTDADALLYFSDRNHR